MNVLKFKNYLKKFNLNNFKDKILENEAIQTKSHIKKCLFRDKQVEMLLIVWPPNYETKVHSHPEGGCISKCIDNKLVEERYNTKTLDIIGKKIFNINDISYIDNKLYYHKIINDTDTISYSLHIYSPPNYYNTNRNISILNEEA